MTEDLKNISFHKTSNVWIVRFVKLDEVFQTSTQTLEDAIALRDKVRDFIDDHGRIPEFEEVGYTPRPRGRKPKPKQTYRFTCSRCNRVTETKLKNNYTNFLNANSVCGKCRLEDAMNRRNSNNRPNKLNQLGERNISFDKRLNHYVFSITRGSESFSCLAKTLEEATSIKKTVLEFIDSNNRLQSKAEGAEMFGYATRERKNSLEPSKSNVSSTGERNISADVCDDIYVVNISRAGRKFSMRIKNLEHAKILRKEVYDYYRTYGMLPKTEEFIERRNQLNDEINRIKG